MRARVQHAEFFYRFTSFLYPGTVYRFDFKTQTSTLLRCGGAAAAGAKMRCDAMWAM